MRAGRKRKPGKRQHSKKELSLLDLDHSGSVVLNNPAFIGIETRISALHSMDETIDWYCSELRFLFGIVDDRE